MPMLPIIIPSISEPLLPVSSSPQVPMSQKFGTAISGSLIALFLGWAGANMITDKMGNTMIDPASVTDSVLTMVWSLFSLFPAFIAFLLMVLAWKFPIKK